MNILVLNGSPKGEYSITLQTCLYIAKQFPEHQFQTLHVGQKIKSLEKSFAATDAEAKGVEATDAEANDFTEAEQMLKEADLILFSYPVYTFLVPAQLHRFIELIKEKGIDLSGKYAAQISTSKHFYDVTAHQFIADNCKDLGLKYLEGLSADMEDLKSAKGQQDAISFFRRILFDIAYDKGQVKGPFENLKDVVIVADLAEDDAKLKAMIDRFMGACAQAKADAAGTQPKLVNIHDFPFKGGCISCFNCAASGECIYQDGFQELLRNEIQSGKAIVLAYTIKDHSMGAQFKLYDDRQFCNGHRTVTMGMPFGYLVSGTLSTEKNLQLLMEARAQVGGNYLAGIASDEEDMAASVNRMAASLSWAIENQYTQPANFYAVGGMKIFRDLIYEMQGLMRADYKFYKSHGQMDFPQKHKGKIAAMYLVGGLMKNKKLKAKMGNKMNEGMIAPYKKVLKDKKQ